MTNRKINGKIYTGAVLPKNNEEELRMVSEFITRDFLLDSEYAKVLYREFAEGMPIIDYHCHLSPEDIANDKKFTNIGEIWLSADHYKWRAMRECGVDEKYITGDASDYEKFKAFVECMPYFYGNPIYHWAHLELRDSFGCNLVIKPENCNEIWRVTSEYIEKSEMSAVSVIEKFNVKIICTTDDPADSLEYHEKINEKGYSFKTLPTFRPDKVFASNVKGYAEYIERLSKANNVHITDIQSLFAALKVSLDRFGKAGCKISDHGFNNCLNFVEPDEFHANEIFSKAIENNGKGITDKEATLLSAQLMRFLAGEYKERGWVMQWHIGAVRNPNERMLKILGRDTGFDAISGIPTISGIAAMLNYLEKSDRLPRTVIYSLNPSDNAAICAIAGSFCKGSFASPYVTQGIAWWFNDTFDGMRNQLKTYAELMPLGKFIGMETDSRSFLSYSRHDYFRRILCSLVGKWMADGFVPDSIEDAGKLISDICYGNAEKYFGF